jgi:hypothetical protein
MRRTTILLLGLLSCSSESSSEASSKRSPQPKAAVAKETPKPPEPPAFLLLPWDTKLRTAPEQYAPALTLVGPSDAEASKHGRGRVIKVVGKADPEGHWWKLETGDAAVPPPTIEGLNVYALSLYVPAGTGEAIGQPVATTPTPTVLAGATVVLQSGEERPFGLEKEWQIDSGTKVFWPNGATAGTVRTTHAFVEAGELRKPDNRELLCFAIRVGPRHKTPTELCVEPKLVREVMPVKPAELFAEELEPEIMEGVNNFAILGLLSDGNGDEDEPGLADLMKGAVED